MRVRIILQHAIAKGSTLLLVMLITGCILPIIISYWYQSVLKQDLMGNRMQYEQRLRLTEGALKYATTYTTMHFEHLLLEPEKILELNEYAHILDKRYTISLIFTPKKEAIAIKVQLYWNQNPAFCMQCLVHKSASITEWKLGA